VLWASTCALPLRGAPCACKQLEVCFDEGKITLPHGRWCNRAVRIHLSGVSSGSDHHRAQKPLVLLRDGTLPDTTGSRHRTLPAHAGVCGHHTPVSPLFFIAYPQTRVPAPSVLGPCGGLRPFLSTHCLIALKETTPFPKFMNPNPIIPRSQIPRPQNVISDNTRFHVSSSSSRHAPAKTQVQPKGYNT